VTRVAQLLVLEELQGGVGARWGELSYSARETLVLPFTEAQMNVGNKGCRRQAVTRGHRCCAFKYLLDHCAQLRQRTVTIGDYIYIAWELRCIARQGVLYVSYYT
jgi:hypothetical protein